MFIFVAILALGLAYAWVKGHLDWVQPQTRASDWQSKVPARMYDQVNEKYKSSRQLQ
jgi:NADH-quinone oxidoreductase subunit A